MQRTTQSGFPHVCQSTSLCIFKMTETRPLTVIAILHTMSGGLLRWLFHTQYLGKRRDFDALIRQTPIFLILTTLSWDISLCLTNPHTHTHFHEGLGLGSSTPTLSTWACMETLPPTSYSRYLLTNPKSIATFKGWTIIPKDYFDTRKENNKSYYWNPKSHPKL